MRRCGGFTLIGLVAILTILGTLAVLTMEMRLRLLKEQSLEKSASAFVNIAQKYDLYYTTNCGAMFVVPALSDLGLMVEETTGFQSSGPFTLGSHVTASGTRYLSVKSSFITKGDAVTSVGLLGRGAKLEADNLTVTFSFCQA